MGAGGEKREKGGSLWITEIMRTPSSGRDPSSKSRRCNDRISDAFLWLLNTYTEAYTSHTFAHTLKLHVHVCTCVCVTITARVPKTHVSFWGCSCLCLPSLHSDYRSSQIVCSQLLLEFWGSEVGCLHLHSKCFYPRSHLSPRSQTLSLTLWIHLAYFYSRS